MRIDRSDIVATYKDLGDGRSLSGQLCPVCKGGRSSERTFSVRREGSKLLYICHRASCNTSGAVQVSTIRAAGDVRTEAGKPKPSTEEPRDSVPLPEWGRMRLAEKYLLDEDTLRRARVQLYKFRFLLPVLSYAGEWKGFTLRLPPNSPLDGPKSLAHYEGTPLAWYRNHKSDHLFLVEDQYSAMRASTYVNAAALLGTNLNAERVEEIIKAGIKRVTLMLDKDASAKALELVVKWRWKLKIVVRFIDKDLKDMTESELVQLVQECT